MEDLLTYLTLISLADEPSELQWIINGRVQSSFSSSTIYLSFFDHAPTVPWFPLIWLKKGIPKHCSLTWLMQLNRSPTRDRLISWGLQTDPLCLLCNQAHESRDHLYFNCPFSSSVWLRFADRLHMNCSSTNWTDVSHSLLSFAGSNQHKYLSILSWQAIIYEIWWERNERLHRGRYQSPDRLCLKINRLIKNKISSMRPDMNALASDLMQLWFSFSIDAN